MDYLDTQLQNIQQDNLQEIDPLTLGFGVAGVVGTVRLVASLATFLFIASRFRNRVKIDKKLTKRMNEILKTNKWVVHEFPDPSPNAFAIGGKHIFITSGLRKLLSKREVEAVLLHEIFHNKDLHIWKEFAYTNTFFYLLVFIGVTASASMGIFYIGFLIFIILNKISKIAYNRIAGRRHEIKADDYAVKYGYGKDLTGALIKIEKYIQKIMRKIQCGKICQLERKISDAIDEHPSTKKRVEIILRKTDKLASVMKSANFMKIKDYITRTFKENG